MMALLKLWSILFISLSSLCWKETNSKPLLFVHFMPWFELPPSLKHWPPYSGMYYTPIIGYYDSSNETVIQWQLSLMKKAGINGVMPYWLGTNASNPHKNQNIAMNKLWEIMRNDQYNFTDMLLGICIDNVDISTSENTFVQDLEYLKDNYFNQAQYLKYTDGNPIMTIFPNTGWSELTPESVNKALSKAGVPDTYLFSNWKSPSYHFNFTGNTYDNIGIYNWVYPNGLTPNSSEDEQINTSMDNNYRYYKDAKDPNKYRSKFYIGSIFHGFSDHYINNTNTQTTNPYNRNGFINEDYGFLTKLYHNTTQSGYDPYIIQIPTWNDYTEGTMIEPNIPTEGCKYGCNDDTESDPYADLITIYQLFVDANADPTQLQKEFEDITKQYFPNL